MEDGCAVAKDRIEQQDRDVRALLAGRGKDGQDGCPVPRTTKKKLLQKQTGALCCSILLHTQLLNRILSAVSSAIEPK